MFEYGIEIDPRVFELDAIVERELESAVDVIAYLLRDRWKEKAAATRSVRSGKYQASIELTVSGWLGGFGNERVWEVEAGVPYAGIIEEVLKPVPGYESLDGQRRPAGLAVESVEVDVVAILGEAAERATAWLR